MSEDNIKVTVKVRPLIKREKERQLPKVWKVNGCTIQHVDANGTQNERFTFDHIFGENTSTAEMFEKIAKPIVDATLKGFNGTIFAYGQTSSGKTHTMLGDEQHPGIMVLAIREIFKEIESSQNQQFLLRIGYIEIYNEKLYDLLDTSNTDLKIQEKSRGEVTVNHREVIVSNEAIIMQQLQAGNKERKTGGTNMNERSSRSHTIFRIVIESSVANDEEDDTDRVVTTSYLNLVDLAGSERADQTGATGSRLKEAGSINKSLLSLSCVIQKLSQAEPDAFINYRDSKLTRILAASLGGNAMTAIICNVTPAAYEETASTLNFGMSAKTIKNKPIINEIYSEAVLMKRLEKEITRLQQEITDMKLRDVNFQDVQFQLFQRQAQILRSKPVNMKPDLQRRRTWAYRGNSDQDQELPSVPVITAPIAPPAPPTQFVRPRGGSCIQPPTFNRAMITSRSTTDTFDSTDPNITPPLNTFSDPFLSPFTQLSTPREWSNRRYLRESKSCNTDAALIEELESELLDLRQFAKAERHFVKGSSSSSGDAATIDQNSEVERLQGELQRLKETYNEEHFELLKFRAGLLQPDDASSPIKNISCGHEDLVERSENFVVELNLMEEINGALEEKITALSAQIDHLTAESMQNKQLCSRLTDELRAAKNSADLAQSMATSVEFEFEQHKANAKRREADLVELLQQHQSQPASAPAVDHSVENINLRAKLQESKNQVELIEQELKDSFERNKQVTESHGFLVAESDLLRSQISDLNLRLNADQTSLQEISSDRDSLRTEIEKLQLRIDCDQAKIVDLNSERDTLKSELTDRIQVAQQHIERLTSEVQENVILLKNRDSRISDLQIQIEAQKSTITSLTVEFNDYKGESTANLQTTNQQIDKITSESQIFQNLARDLQERIDIEQSIRTALTTERDFCKSEMLELQNKISSSKQHSDQMFADVENENKNLVFERDSLRTQIADLKLRIESDQSNMNSWNSERELLKSEIFQINERAKVMETDLLLASDFQARFDFQELKLTELTEENNCQKSGILVLQNQLSDAKDQNTQLLADIERMGTERDLLQTKIVDLQLGIENSQEKLKNFTTERDSLNSELIEVSEQLNSIKMKHSVLIIENDSLHTQIRDLQHRIDSNSLNSKDVSELTDLRSQLNDTQKHVDQLVADIERHEKTSSDHKTELSNVLLRFESEKPSLQIMTAERDSLQLEKNDHCTEIETLKANRNTLGAQIEELELLVENENTKLGNLQADLDILASRLVEVTAQQVSEEETRLQQINDLKNETEALTTERNDLRDQIEKLQLSIDQETTLRSEQLEVKCTEIKLLASTLEASSADRQSMLDSVCKATERIDSLQTEMTELRQLNELLTKEINTKNTAEDENLKSNLLSQLGTVTEERDDAAARLDQVSNRLATLEVEHSALAQTLTESAHSLETITIELDTMILENEKLSSSNQKVIEQFNELTRSNQLLQTNFETSNSEIDELKKQLSLNSKTPANNNVDNTDDSVKTDNSNRHLQEEIDKLSNRLATFARIFDSLAYNCVSEPVSGDASQESYLQSVHDQIISEIERVLEKNADQEHEVKRISAKLNDANALQKSTEKLQSEFEKQYAAARNECEEQQKILENTIANSLDLEDRLCTANDTIGRLDQEKTMLSEQLAVATDRAEHLAAQLRSLEESQQHVSDELTIAIDRRDQLQTELSASTECSEKLQSQLDATLVDLDQIRLLNEQLTSEKNNLYIVVENNRTVIEQTEEECNSMRISYVECMGSIKTLQEENDELRRQTEKHAQDLAEAQQQLAELEKLRNSCKELKQELSVQKDCKDVSNDSMLKEMQQRCDELAKGIDCRQFDLETLTDKVDLLTKELSHEHKIKETLAADNYRLIAEAKKQKIQSRETEQETEKLRSSHENIVKSMHAVSLQIRERELQLETQRTLNEANISEVKRLTALIHSRDEETEQKQLAIIQRLQQDLHKEQQITVELTAHLDQFKRKNDKDNDDHAARLKEVEHKCRELQQRCQDQQQELVQRTDLDAQLQYHKGLCESLRQASDKAKHEAATASDRLLQVNEENTRLVKQHQTACQELRDLRMQMHSEQSFQEKEQKINELQTDLQRVKREESMKRQQMIGENDSLRTKFQNMQKELTDLRGRLQKDRRTSRRSVHDESRTIDDPDVAEKELEKTAQQCAECEELSAKVKKLNGEIYIKECHITRLKMVLDNNSMLRENEELRQEAKKHGASNEQWRQEVAKLNAALVAAKAVPPPRPIPCLKCAKPKHLKDFGQQTEPAPVYNGSAIITETDNDILQQDLRSITRKYQLSKQVCRDRQLQIEEYKKRLAELMLKNNNNACVPTGEVNGDCKENEPINKVTGGTDHKRLQAENQRLQHELLALQKIKSEPTAEASSESTCQCMTDEARLKAIIDEMEDEIAKSNEKNNALKKIIVARNRHIQLLETRVGDCPNAS